jgi:hypothetical protein
MKFVIRNFVFRNFAVRNSVIRDFVFRNNFVALPSHWSKEQSLF